MIRRVLAAWLALTATDLPSAKVSALNSSTTTGDPWSPLLGDTEGAPVVTEPSPERRRGAQSLVDNIRSQLMQDNYDYIGRGSEELRRPSQNAQVPVNRASKAFDDDKEVEAFPEAPRYRASNNDQFPLSQATRRKTTEYTVTVKDKDLLYYLDDNYMRYKYLVSEIPFRRRSINNTVHVNSGRRQSQVSTKNNDKGFKNKNEEDHGQTLADVTYTDNGQQQHVQQNIATNITRNSDINEQHGEWKSDISDENKNVTNNNDHTNELSVSNGNISVSQENQHNVNRRMYYKRPPNDEVDRKRRSRRHKLKRYSKFSHKNKALRKAVLRDKARLRRNKMYKEQNKVLQDSQKYIQHLKKYKAQRYKGRKHSSYQLKTKKRQNALLRRHQLTSGRHKLRRRGYQKELDGQVHADLKHDAADYYEENDNQTDTSINNDPAFDKQEENQNDKQEDIQEEHQEDKQDTNISHPTEQTKDEINDSLTENDEYVDGQQMNQIQSNIENSLQNDDDTDGGWKATVKTRYVNSLERAILDGKLILGNDGRRMDKPQNDSQLELHDVKYQEGLNETHYDDTEGGVNDNQLSVGQNNTSLKDNKTTTLSVKYKLIKVKTSGSRRSNKAERSFLQERRPDGGVSLIAIDGGPFPQFRLPLSRRQYMFESRLKHNPLEDQLPKVARPSTHKHLN